MSIYMIVDVTSMEVGVDVNEFYINRVHYNQSMHIRLNVYPLRAYEDRVLAGWRF